MKKFIVIVSIILMVPFLSNLPEKKNVVVKSNLYKEANLEIQEQDYFISDGFIQPISLKTEKSQFLKGFKATSGELSLDCNNNSNYVGTGCNLKTVLNQTITSSNGIIVYGDVTGDGVGSITDMVKMVLHSSEKQSISDKAKQFAADIDYDKKISVTDAISLASKVQAGIAIPHPSSKDIETVIELSTNSIVLEKNQNVKIIATTNKGDITIINWKSADSNIALVDSTGLVTGVNSGSTKITVTAKDGTKRELTVTVNVTVPVTGVSVNKSSLTLIEGESEQLIATISPSNATNNQVVWTSSNTDVATVDGSGKILAKKAGTTNIVVKTKDGDKIASCNLTVVSKTISVTGVSLNATSGTKYLNSTSKSFSLSAAITPSNATNKGVSWTSSNTEVATVDNTGKITINDLGTSNITVTTIDGSHKATYKLVVKRKVIVVVTASLGKRMTDWFKTYTSTNNYKYSISDKTLKYVYDSGSGFDYQVGEGITNAKTFIDDNYSNKKDYVEISLFFTMTGNSVKNFTCDDIGDSSKYEEIASDYNGAVNKIKNADYNVKGFLTSHSPLNTKHEDASSNKIVASTNSNACSSDGYRSNWKYYLSNNRIKDVLKDYSNLTFVNYYSAFLRLDDATNRKFTWLKDFTTEDALHWDENTTISCMTTIFELAGM